MSDRATLYGSVAQIAALDPGTRATLYGSVAQIAALDPGVRATLYGSVAQIAALDPGIRATLYGSVAQVAALQPTPVASVGNISGAPGVSATFDGSGSQNHHYYEWEWTSLPGGSALFNYPVLYPDSGAATPIDMTDNVGLWHFDGDADDTSGNNNDGTVNGASLVTGKFGQCYEFDGSNDYIEVAHSAELDATSAVSIALWIYVDDFGAWSGIVCKGTNTLNYGLNQAADGSGKLQFFAGGSPWTSYVQSTAVVPTGEWKHVAVTWDAGTVKFFVDGSLDSTHSVAWSLSTNSEALIIGADFPGSNQYFNGKIDELAIWTRVLSPTEITDIYDKQSKVGLGSSTATASFTPDVAGTYTVQLEVADGVTATADAVIGTSGPENIDSIFGISKDNIGSIMGITYGDIDKINDID